MRRYFFIVFLILVSCKSKKSGLEICFTCIQNRLNSDTLVDKIKYCPVDSYTNVAYLINKTLIEESKSSSICPNALDKFLLENNENSITVNNLILFQQFQAYLKHKDFNQIKAKEIALIYEARLKHK